MVNNTQLVLRGPKCAKKLFPHTVTPSHSTWATDTREDGSLLSCGLLQILTGSDCLGRIQHLVDLNALIYTSVVTIGYLSYCCLQQEPTKHFHLDLPLTEYFCFSAPFSVNLKRCRKCYAGKFHVIPINDHVTQHHSFLILMRCLNFSRCRDHVCMHKCVESFPCDLLIRYSCINSQVYLTK